MYFSFYRIYKVVFLRVIGGIGVLCILVSIDEPQKKKGKAIHCISLS